MAGVAAGVDSPVIRRAQNGSRGSEYVALLGRRGSHHRVHHRAARLDGEEEQEQSFLLPQEAIRAGPLEAKDGISQGPQQLSFGISG